MLVDAGIDSVSLNPDSVLKVRQRLAKHEAKMTTESKGEKVSHKKGLTHGLFAAKTKTEAQ